MPWYESGSRMSCANCGKHYNQDFSQEKIDKHMERMIMVDPNPYVLCPDCRFPDVRGSLGKVKK